MSDRKTPTMPACFMQCPAMRAYVRNLRITEARLLFMSKTVSCEPGTKRHTARCPICGKTFHKRMWSVEREDEMYASLQSHFEFCEKCGEWVCKDCYYILTDKSNGEMCRKCAEANGEEGATERTHDAYIRGHPLTKEQSEEQIRQLARIVRRRQKETDALLGYFKGVDLFEPIDFYGAGCDPPDVENKSGESTEKA